MIDSVWSTSVEETEPLGQKIYNADPDPIPDPTYENAMRNADFPQWQCAVSDNDKDWGSFEGLPFHCQMQILKDLSRDLDEIWGFTNPNRETDPSNLEKKSGNHKNPKTLRDYLKGQSKLDEFLSKSILRSSKPKNDNGETDGEPCTITAPDGTTAKGVIKDGKCVIPEVVKEEVTITADPVSLPIDPFWKSYRADTPWGSYVELRRSDESIGQQPLYWPTPPSPKPPNNCSLVGLSYGGFIGAGNGYQGFSAIGSGMLAVDNVGATSRTTLAVSGGGFYNPLSAPSVGYPSNDGTAIGFALGKGPGIVFANAPGQDLEGPFETRIVATPLFTAQFDNDPRTDTKVTTFSGPSPSLGYFSFRTTTPRPIVAEMAGSGCQQNR